MSKQDVEVNKFHVDGDDGGVDEAFVSTIVMCAATRSLEYKGGEAGAENSAYL